MHTLHALPAASRALPVGGAARGHAHHKPPQPRTRAARPLHPRTAGLQHLSTQAAASLQDQQAPPSGATSPPLDIVAKVEFLRRDLQHLFDDVGIDASAYDEVVEFRDPITNYNSLSGYLFNIQMLRRVFDPVFELHDIRAIGPYAVLSRWTMTMDFTPARVLPLPWKPRLMFSGTSTYVFNPATQRINKHIDTWDSISNQQFFSLEGFIDVLRQLSDLATTPAGLEQPAYQVLRRTSDYQVRKYEPFVVAQTWMDDVKGASTTDASASTSASSNPVLINPAAGGSRAFGTLARYLFGGNERKEAMKMTTPVFSDTQGTMQFVMEPSKHKDPSQLPRPAPGAPVELKEMSVGVVAARAFPGLAFQNEVEREAQALFAALRRDGVPFEESEGYRLARYNDPGTLPPFRRNEVMVKLGAGYDPLWAPGELDAFREAAARE